MNRVVVHVGTHKTGTTTIQTAIRQAFRSGAHDEWKVAELPDALAAELMRSQVPDRGLVDNLRDVVRGTAGRFDRHSDVVVSSEALLGLPVGGYMNSRVVLTMVRDAVIDRDALVVVYLRQQDDWLESMYTQTIHEGRSWGIQEFLENFVDERSLDYGRLTQEMESLFGTGRVVVRSYHTASRQGLLSDFGAILGCGSLLADGTISERMNPSYSPAALEIARICNERLDASGRRRLRGLLQKRLPKRPNTSFSYLNHATRVAVRRRHAASNDAVAQKYLSDQADPWGLPSDPSDSDSAHVATISLETVATMLTDLLQGSRPNGAAESGVLAGIRVVLNGYPGVKRILKSLVGRT